MAEATAEHAALEARLHAAVRAGDARALAQAYRQAADISTGDDAAGYFLTHAYVWALVASDASTTLRLEKGLRHQGRLD